MASPNKLVVEFCFPADGGDAVIAHDGTVLDAASAFSVDHADGTVKAVMPPGHVPETLDCGIASTRDCRFLASLDKAILCRKQGEDMIAVSEVALRHTNR